MSRNLHAHFPMMPQDGAPDSLSSAPQGFPEAQRQRSVPRQTPDVSSQAAAAQHRSAEPAAVPAEETPEQVSHKQRLP